MQSRRRSNKPRPKQENSISLQQQLDLIAMDYNAQVHNSANSAVPKHEKNFVSLDLAMNYNAQVHNSSAHANREKNFVSFEESLVMDNSAYKSALARIPKPDKFTSFEKHLDNLVVANNFNALKLVLAGVDDRHIMGRFTWTYGESPLQTAALLGRDEMIRMLVKAGCLINSSAVSGINMCSTVFFAVMSKRPQTVRVCLQLGAVTSMMGRWEDFLYEDGLFGGFTAVELAERKGLKEIANILKSADPELPLKLVAKKHQEDEKAQMEKEKASLELELFAALDIQSDIDRRSQQISDMENEKLKLTLEQSMLRKEPAFRGKKRIKEIRAKLDSLNSFSVQNVSLAEKEESDPKACPICFEDASQVFSCVQCDHWICECCRGRLVSCPSCRLDFLLKPPRRNRAVEIALGV